MNEEQTDRDPFNVELDMLRDFYAHWKVLHMDPERRIKLQAAESMVKIAHEYDGKFWAQRLEAKQSKVKQALKLVHG